jgi:phospholipase D1/2
VKDSGGRFREEKKSCLRYYGKCCRTRNKRWFILTDQFIIYMINPKEKQQQDLQFIDHSFNLKFGKLETSNELGIVAANKTRTLKLEAHDHFEWKLWKNRFEKVMAKSPYGPNSIFRYKSFSNEKMGNHVECFIDGENYYQKVYESLVRATQQVYITDWWLTPELYLKRPVNFDSNDMEKYRLDNILQALAENGVKIFIIVYKEVEIAGLYHDSAYTKLALQSKHENIKVLRHPRTIVSYWSHHEKL